ncbi:hypothetical protein POM88_050386 [Heracleum sosnowskyi]|uniref:Helitron helicase-like domain-containing protein n=1 Tax=Heracleum sosnowskyi TaxID=360622 RepID=A0AAD8H021_9APIA|nr:hypothetical protein POM88_050386 [Heracleum sosnowskyi]
MLDVPDGLSSKFAQLYMYDAQEALTHRVNFPGKMEEDALVVCKEYGDPDLFITFTCNPKWDEIQEAVRSSGSQDASVRPDLVARVFKMKLDAMMNDFTKKTCPWLCPRSGLHSGVPEARLATR